MHDAALAIIDITVFIKNKEYTIIIIIMCVADCY